MNEEKISSFKVRKSAARYYIGREYEEDGEWFTYKRSVLLIVFIKQLEVPTFLLIFNISGLCKIETNKIYIDPESNEMMIVLLSVLHEKYIHQVIMCFNASAM